MTANYATLAGLSVMIRPSRYDPDWIAERDREANARLVAGVMERLYAGEGFPVLRQPCEDPAELVTDLKSLPQGARKIATIAAASGWRVVCTRSRGVGVKSTITAIRIHNVYALRLSYPADGPTRLRAYASWTNGRTERVMVKTPGALPLIDSVTKLEELIRAIASAAPRAIER